MHLELSKKRKKDSALGLFGAGIPGVAARKRT
jgi:hypothetical protein